MSLPYVLCRRELAGNVSILWCCGCYRCLAAGGNSLLDKPPHRACRSFAQTSEDNEYLTQLQLQVREINVRTAFVSGLPIADQRACETCEACEACESCESCGGPEAEQSLSNVH